MNGAQSGEQIFNNPDSFAMKFDDEWKNYNSGSNQSNLSSEKKLEEVFSRLKEHPFLKDNKEKASEIARFRIRLLNLK